MNRALVQEAANFPVGLLEILAESCGVAYADSNDLLELSAIIQEEIIENDSNRNNALSAFVDVKDKVARRFKAWHEASVSHALDV